jgi:hypothetical protein
VTPDAAVARLAEIIAARGEFSEDDIYAAMAEAGIPDAVADRAYKFIQIAWGRVFLDGLGVRFSSDYLCFNGAGEVVESGLLAEEPYFVAAMSLAQQYARFPGFPRFALMSADVNAVNSALKAGSKPENLVMAPAALFLEAATPEGIDKARQFLAGRTTSPSEAGSSERRELRPANKPWWRFW